MIFNFYEKLSYILYNNKSKYKIKCKQNSTKSVSFSSKVLKKARITQMTSKVPSNNFEKKFRKNVTIVPKSGPTSKFP